jgi:flagellar biosynthesis protein FlhA
MADAQLSLPTGDRRSGRDVAFALGIVFILAILFLPIPASVIDFCLALSIGVSILILLVALWIQRPLDFSAFPTVLLVVTMLRLSLNIATTRLILSEGNTGETAAGHVIGGFASLLMSGDFVIGLVIFLIIVTVNFVVITKGATRIAEVGARFTLDAIPGKQMAIDADLSAGIIDEKQAQLRRRELEEESSFFGAMDGASKFVRGDAIAGLLITFVNIIGGIAIGVWRHEMPMGEAADIYTRLSVGDGLVSQVPALITSLAAGLLVSKGGNKGSADVAVLNQLGNYPRALIVSGGLMFLLALTPGLPFVQFFLLGLMFASAGVIIPRRSAAAANAVERARVEKLAEEEAAKGDSVRGALQVQEVELLLGRQLRIKLLARQDELAHRVARMRQRFAREFGFVVPGIKVSESFDLGDAEYEIRIHGTSAARQKVSLSDVLVIASDRRPPFPCEDAIEPAFGMAAWRVPEIFQSELQQAGYEPIDLVSVMLTHLSEVIKANLPQLFSYRDMRMLIKDLDPEYARLVDELCPSQISISMLQAVFKLLLAEAVSIRNIGQVLEAVAEVAPHVKRAEAITEHVRMRLAAQICGDIFPDRVVRMVRLGSRWEQAFQQALKRNNRGEIVEFAFDPMQLEEFGRLATTRIGELVKRGERFAVTTSPDARPYVRMVTERVFPNVPVLSNVEIAKGLAIEAVDQIA